MFKEKEDPNLLNNPELLFRECEKLPAPKSVCSEDEELYWQSAKLIREILLNHNFILVQIFPSFVLFLENEKLKAILLYFLSLRIDFRSG